MTNQTRIVSSAFAAGLFFMTTTIPATADGLGLGVGASVGGISAGAGASIGGSGGTRAGVGASLGGSGGVSAGGGASIGGSSGISAGAGASLGGSDGVNAGLGANVGGSGGIRAGVGAGLGTGVGVGVGVGVATNNPGTPGTRATGYNPRLASLVDDMSSQELLQTKKRCNKVVGNSSRFDRDLVALCRRSISPPASAMIGVEPACRSTGSPKCVCSTRISIAEAAEATLHDHAGRQRCHPARPEGRRRDGITSPWPMPGSPDRGSACRA